MSSSFSLMPISPLFSSLFIYSYVVIQCETFTKATENDDLSRNPVHTNSSEGFTS